MKYPRIPAHRDVDSFRRHVASLGFELPVDDGVLSAEAGSPLAEPLNMRGLEAGNRWVVHPMEGWDANRDGSPSELTLRRWQNFGRSGCQIIWGGEAVAVREDGRANPNQLFVHGGSEAGVSDLLTGLVDAHIERFGEASARDLVVGLQLTHSGRYARPYEKKRLAPSIAYHHPVLDARVGIEPGDDGALLSDGDLRRLTDDFVAGARMAQRCGFQFVDIKHCHAYLGHELLSAHTRPGPYGGDFEGRTRFLRETVQAVTSECPDLRIGVRLSLYDHPPYQPTVNADGEPGPGIPIPVSADFRPFGAAADDFTKVDLSEPIRLLQWLRDQPSVFAVNVTAGSPYYSPHLQRPAYYPPSDGYLPPEDPLAGCLRQMHAVRAVRQAVPGLPLIGSGYSYLQEFLPHVAQALVRDGWVDAVGIGRLVLSYWDLPADSLASGEITRPKKICRTFSDCTTAPRNGLISGCYPLDDFYKSRPEFEELKAIKKG